MSDEKKPVRAAPMRGLGRGLSALLGEDSDAVAPAPSTMRGARQIAIEQLHRGRYQPRRNFDEEQMQALADSIRAQGVLQPLLVRAHPERPGEFEILAGERRWRAAQLAQLAQVPVVVRDITDREAMEIALVENVQRQDLNPIEEARGYQRLHEEFSHTQEEIARVTGKSRPHVANALRLLTLPGEIVAMVEAGALSAGHARALIGHADALAIAKEAASRGMSVRQVEERARQRPGVKPARVAQAGDANSRALERELEGSLGMKTKITDEGGGKGTISFAYASLDQLDELLRRLRRE